MNKLVERLKKKSAKQKAFLVSLFAINMAVSFIISYSMDMPILGLLYFVLSTLFIVGIEH